MKQVAIFALILLFAIPLSAQYPVPTEIPVYEPPHYASSETFALVSVNRANLRTAPTTAEGAVVDVAVYGERFRIVGIFFPEENLVVDPLSEEGELVFDDIGEHEVWYLVEVKGGQAWIFGGVVLISQPDGLPSTEQNLTPEQQALIDQQVAFAANSVGVRASLNIRSAPSTNASVVGILAYGDRATVIGRNEYGTWLYVNYGAIYGWVSIYYILTPPDYNLNAVPIIR